MSYSRIAEPPPGLNRVIPYAHQAVAEVLRPGDLAIDLTAGNGHDTLFLHRCVEPAGLVLAFDIQEQALAATACRLKENGADVVRVGDGADSLPGAGVGLVQACHSAVAGYLDRAPVAVMANLGYLPGGDRTIVTRAETTVAALSAAAERLAPGGRIAVVVYVAHPGGGQECRAVDDWCASLVAVDWETQKVSIPNRADAPLLYIAGRKALA